MTKVRSSLSNLKPVWRDPDPEAAFKRCKEAWHATGIVCLNPDEIEKTLGWARAQEARNLGEALYGKRRGK
jgi:hypothetical protein